MAEARDEFDEGVPHLVDGTGAAACNCGPVRDLPELEPSTPVRGEILFDHLLEGFHRFPCADGDSLMPSTGYIEGDLVPFRKHRAEEHVLEPLNETKSGDVSGVSHHGEVGGSLKDDDQVEGGRHPDKLGNVASEVHL